MRPSKSINRTSKAASIFLRAGLCLLAWIIPAGIAVSLAATVAAPKIHIAQGAVRGQTRDGVSVFRAIPYAAAPVGSLRFRPPERAKPWTGVLEAVADGPSCPQLPSVDPAGKASSTEDCLRLNIFAPAGGFGARHPVIVWMHGGGWVEGFAGAPQYNASALVREGGIVVVSINYRLGVLGLLATKSLDDANGEPSGNWLIRDQLEALRWVKENIATFGGDPDNITIAGESAGANSVLALVTSPLSGGLFQKAIVESGVGDAHTLNRTRMEQTGQEIATALGCAAGPGQVDCLRKAPVEAILKAGKRLGIVEDPKIFPLDPYAAYRAGKFQHVPMLLGSNLHESYLFVARTKSELGHPMTEMDYATLVKARFGAKADTVMKLYPAKSDPAMVLGDAETDTEFACYMNLAREGASKFTRVFGYEMNEPNPVQQQPVPASLLANTSYHTSELAYLFDYAGAPITGKAADLARKIRGYWINFIKTGSPGGETLPDWPRFQGPAGALLYLSTAGGTTTDFASRHNCAALQKAGLVSSD